TSGAANPCSAITTRSVRGRESRRCDSAAYGGRPPPSRRPRRPGPPPREPRGPPSRLPPDRPMSGLVTRDYMPAYGPEGTGQDADVRTSDRDDGRRRHGDDGGHRRARPGPDRPTGGAPRHVPRDEREPWPVRPRERRDQPHDVEDRARSLEVDGEQ